MAEQDRKESLAQVLSYIFGPDSRGSTSKERARTSSRSFIRSQDQLAVHRSKGTGRILTAFEALNAFGYKKLYEAVDHGSAILPSTREEPARTIRSRREDLGLTINQVARAAGVPPKAIADAEDEATTNPIQVLEAIAQHLGLDDQAISVRPGGGGDEALAVRLKTYATEGKRFSSELVEGLAEAAWISMTESRLREWMGESSELVAKFEPSSNYGTHDYPAWQHGYWLARETRRMLGLENEPVAKLRELCYELVIPVIQTELPDRCAGATVESSGYRGIVVNTAGWNQNVWVRRATLAHELGHLLWDPPRELESLRVDEYEVLESPPWSAVDAVEARANAFAIEFLAPQAGLVRLLSSDPPSSEDVRRIMETYGVSFTAASYHLWNALDRSFKREDLHVDDVEPSDEWKAAEDWTLDWFPLKATPLSRRGGLAIAVVRAEKEGLISEDTAASYLKTTVPALRAALKSLEDLAG